jgi:hypothetical protein
MRGRARAFVPATPVGVMELLARSGLDVAGRSAVVLGDSNVGGRMGGLAPGACRLAVLLAAWHPARATKRWEGA